MRLYLSEGADDRAMLRAVRDAGYENPSLTFSGGFYYLEVDVNEDDEGRVLVAAQTVDPFVSLTPPR